MRFGLQIYQDPGAENLWDDVLAKARAAEESGFDSVWLWDHLMFDRTWGESDWGPTLECFTGLARPGWSASSRATATRSRTCRRV